MFWDKFSLLTHLLQVPVWPQISRNFLHSLTQQNEVSEKLFILCLKKKNIFLSCEIYVFETRKMSVVIYFLVLFWNLQEEHFLVFKMSRKLFWFVSFLCRSRKKSFDFSQLFCLFFLRRKCWMKSHRYFILFFNLEPPIIYFRLTPPLNLYSAISPEEFGINYIQDPI